MHVPSDFKLRKDTIYVGIEHLVSAARAQAGWPGANPTIFDFTATTPAL
jgi:hypothetical protein